MNENPSRNNIDGNLISLKQGMDREYWTKKYSVSIEILQSAIDDTCSHEVKTIEEWLSRNNYIR